MRSVYLDHAATSPLLPEVKAKMLEVMDLELGNASALHRPGHSAKRIIDDAREQVARLINASPEEIIFTSGGSESNNTVINIFRDQKITTSAIEHPSILEPARKFAKELVLLEVDKYGFIQVDDIPHDTDLVSVMFANNELGTIEPVADIVKHVHSKVAPLKSEQNNVHFGKNQNTPVWVSRRQELRKLSEATRHRTYVHTDATQAIGKVKLDVRQLDVDYLTFSAHKIGGPTGIGVLYVKKDSPYRPLIYGGHQENQRRAGTMNTIAIAGLGAATKWAWDNWSCRQYEKVAILRDKLRERILAEVPYSSVNSPVEKCLPNLLNMSFQAAEGESIQLYLDVEGVIVGTGSACAAGDIKPSHVLMAARHDAEVAHSSIRFSLGLNTTEADIERVMTVLPAIVKRLQGISTVQVADVVNAEHSNE